MNVNEVRASFQIVGSKIKKLEIKNDFVFVDLSDDKIVREVGVSYDVSKPFILEGSDESLAGKVMLYIDLKMENDECASYVELELEGCFTIDDSKEDILEEMLPTSGCAALYSIARGIISSITSQMCVNGTLLIPMINTFELRDAMNKEEILEDDDNYIEGNSEVKES